MQTKSTTYSGKLLDTPLLTHEEAAAEFGLDLKRLRGWIFRGFDSIAYPIGDETHVYRSSLEAFLKRQADRADGVTP
jgi:hypothetical protein